MGMLRIIWALCVFGLLILCPSSKANSAGSVAYADFKGAVTGRLTFSRLPEEKSRITGQFNTGFESPVVEDYEFAVADSNLQTIVDLTQEFRDQIVINVPGTAPFQVDMPSPLPEETSEFVIRFKGNIITNVAILGV